MTSPRRDNRDLVWVAVLAAAGLIAAFVPLPNPLRALLAAPLVLALPGYALSICLFPERSFPALERALLSFVLSISACVLPGLVVQVFFDLTLHAWGITLAVVTWAAVAVAMSRREGVEPAEKEPRKAPSEPISRPGLRVAISASLILASLVIAAVAVAISADNVQDEEHRHEFLSLWAVPGEAGPDSGVKIGVWNHDVPRESFHLTVDRDGEQIRDFRLKLGPADRWVVSLPPDVTAGDGTMVITLSGTGVPNRRVELEEPPR